MEPEGDAPQGMSSWRCLAKAGGRLRVGQRITIPGTDVALTVLAERASDGSLLVGAPVDALAFLDAHGRIPLPTT